MFSPKFSPETYLHPPFFFFFYRWMFPWYDLLIKNDEIHPKRIGALPGEKGSPINEAAVETVRRWNHFRGSNSGEKRAHEKIPRPRLALVFGYLSRCVRNESVRFGALRFHGWRDNTLERMPHILVRVHWYLLPHHIHSVQKIPQREEGQSDSQRGGDDQGNSHRFARSYGKSLRANLYFSTVLSQVTVNYLVAMHDLIFTIFTRKTFSRIWNAQQDFDERLSQLGYPRKETKIKIAAWILLASQIVIWTAVNQSGMFAFEETWTFNVSYMCTYIGTATAVYKFFGMASFLGLRFHQLNQIAKENLPPRVGYKSSNVSRQVEYLCIIGLNWAFCK